MVGFRRRKFLETEVFPTFSLRGAHFIFNPLEWSSAWYKPTMGKPKTQFTCQQCGQSFNKWAGRCQECGEWNSIVEELVSSHKESKPFSTPSKPCPVQEVASVALERLSSGIGELDNILGGGLVPGSVILLGGEPGVGKSTILLQVADYFANHHGKVLYASGEESTTQIALRSSRLGTSSNNILLYAENSLEAILTQIENTAPNLIIVDSIQTLSTETIQSHMGSVGQIRECANLVISAAKSKNIPTFLVGHVTKEGTIAGPKLLEHMVDVVLYFESTSSQTLRLLRSMKNRFGACNEVGVFEIGNLGLKAVSNPSELFLSERPTGTPGSIITASLEGSRPLLVEVQALATSTPLAMPRRTAIGIDPQRLSLLVAILEKRGGLRLFDQDVYLNVAGGLRLAEPASDLAVCAAVQSSYTGKCGPAKAVFFGEVGLGGEVRSVPRAVERLREARKIGFEQAYIPAKIAKELKGDTPGIETIAIEHIQQLGDFLG